MDDFSAKTQLFSRAQEWVVSIDHTLETSSSMLGFGSRRGVPVVLKIIRKLGDEWHSGDVLQAYGGDGTVQVFESDAGAVLLERLIPGNQLVELVQQGNDEDATKILAGVMRAMSNHVAPAHCPTVFDWARGFDRYLETSDTTVPIDLVLEARELYLSLATSQKQTMLLHGDLQHYNVLFDSKRAWVAIDPKGVVGELEYEVGAMLRNPVEQPDFFISPEVIERRLRIMVEELELDYRRVLEWSFAQAVLSLIWDIEDGFPVPPDHHTFKLAQSIRNLLR